MAESILKMFDGNGSPLAVPVSPANGVTPDAVSIVGVSQLHNQYAIPCSVWLYLLTVSNPKVSPSIFFRLLIFLS